MQLKQLYTPILLTSLLAGCGQPVLVKQESATEVSSGQNVITEIDKFNDTIYTSQSQLAVSILATNPDCGYSENFIVIHTDTKANKLCLSQNELPVYQNDKSIGRKFFLFPASKTILGSTNQVVAALSAYLEGLAKFTSDPSHPIADDIQKTLDQLNTTNDAIKNFVPANSENDIQNILPMASSLPNLIGFFEELHKNAQDAASIKTYLKTQQTAIKAIEMELTKIAKNAGEIYGKTYYNHTLEIQDSLSTYYNKNKDRKDSQEFSTEKSREDFLYRITQQKALAEQVKNLQNPLSQAISNFNSSHQKLIDLLDNKLSDADKAKIAAENIKEFNTGLKGFADLASFALKLAAL